VPRRNPTTKNTSHNRMRSFPTSKNKQVFN